jgi:hypothetical protein
MKTATASALRFGMTSAHDSAATCGVAAAHSRTRAPSSARYLRIEQAPAHQVQIGQRNGHLQPNAGSTLCPAKVFA